MTENTDENGSTRRNVLIGVAGLGAAGLFGAGRASAQTDPVAEIGTEANPYLRAHLDRVTFYARTSDPSDVSGGTIWYRGDLS